VQFVAQFAGQVRVGRQGAQAGGAQLLLLQFRQLTAQLEGKARPPGAFAEQLQFAIVPPEQGAQHHEAPLGRQQPGRGDMQPFKNKGRKPVEG